MGVSAESAADVELMRRALASAEAAARNGEVPVGAVLTGPDGTVLAETANAPIRLHDASAHAEILALRAAGRALGNYRLVNCTIHVTLEPCAMCTAALVHARIARLVYAASDPKAGACGSVFDLAQSDKLNHRIDVVGGVLAGEASKLLGDFFAARR
jgi:tRNA(adenine34) deaminase